MTPLGKSLVFYLKYMAEMNRLYGEPVYFEGEQPDLTGLANADQVREMTRIVGSAAYEQVADFLELYGEAVEKHFTALGIATVSNRRSRAYTLRNWDWGARVYVSSVADGWFACGAQITAPPECQISLTDGSCGIVVPWLWSKGGRKATEAIWKILGGWPHSRGGEGVVNERATIALACIPIKAQPPESFDVDRDQLLTEVMRIIARIGADETKAIATFVAGLKEPDEG